MHGWIGGSCAQPTVIKESLKALAADECRLIRLSTEPEERTSRAGVIDLPMTCFSSGTLEIYIEPQHPRRRILIVGSLPVAQALAHLGGAMSYHVIAVDLDGSGDSMSHADEVFTSLDAVTEQIQPYTYVVVATHANYDELALERILLAKPTYVGLVASPKQAQAVRDYLVGRGLSESEILPLKAPAGLDIQARRGDEIALSIMAEIVQKRRSEELLNLELFKNLEDAHEEQDHVIGSLSMASEQEQTAVDPVCQMIVTIATAKFTSNYDDTDYYFCCAGCKTTFEADPTSFIREETTFAD
jgi:xanthine dehydrogenase accessory factor